VYLNPPADSHIFEERTLNPTTIDKGLETLRSCTKLRAYDSADGLGLDIQGFNNIPRPNGKDDWGWTLIWNLGENDWTTTIKTEEL
jgi:hypothetical protein